MILQFVSAELAQDDLLSRAYKIISGLNNSDNKHASYTTNLKKKKKNLNELLGKPINKHNQQKIYTDHLKSTNTWQCADMWNACAVYHIKAILGKSEGKYCYIAC